ncbi:MAG: RNA methyltransferase, partial [Deltaproteobacteria bacterium]|nr:RNA methyltransferase [Deltaproteobacteria bacterium]
RLGSHRGPFFSPRDLAPRIVDILEENKVALLFGPERTGLTTAQLRLCQAVVRIPTADQEVSSLNIAQAVLILGYELLLVAQGPTAQPTVVMAPQKEIADMYDHFSRTMVKVGFLPDQNTDLWLMSFKHIFNRSGLTHGDCNLLRGMCRQILWALNNTDKIRQDQPNPIDDPT